MQAAKSFDKIKSLNRELTLADPEEPIRDLNLFPCMQFLIIPVNIIRIDLTFCSNTL